MADQIIIRNLEIYSNHGVYKEEKVLGQKFLVSAVLDTDTKRAGISDCIDFQWITEKCVTELRKSWRTIRSI